MGASKTHSVKFPQDLYDILSLRAKATGYKSPSAYVKGLVRYDALVQGPHIVTVPWSNLPEAKQDEVDSRLLEMTKLGIGERGVLLKHLLDEAVKQGGSISAETILEAFSKHQPAAVPNE